MIQLNKTKILNINGEYNVNIRLHKTPKEEVIATLEKIVEEIEDESRTV